MSYTDRVLKAMRQDTEYDPETIASITHIQLPEVAKSLNLLARSGLIEQTQMDRFIRARKYKTRQRDLPL